MNDATPILRIQENVLARQERRLLNWLCPRLPTWVTPDMLTSLALIAAVIIFTGYALSGLNRNWLWLSVAGYFVHWFGDSLDGSIARFRSIERQRAKLPSSESPNQCTKYPATDSHSQLRPTMLPT